MSSTRNKKKRSSGPPWNWPLSFVVDSSDTWRADVSLVVVVGFDCDTDSGSDSGLMSRNRDHRYHNYHYCYYSTLGVVVVGGGGASDMNSDVCHSIDSFHWSLQIAFADTTDAAGWMKRKSQYDDACYWDSNCWCCLH